jgi:Putative metallopeptidase
MLTRAKVMALGLILICSIQQAAWAAAPPDLKSNRIEISYVKPTNQAHQNIYEVLQQRRVLERFQGYLSALRLPRTLFLKTAGCDGVSNAWYDESEHTVTVCYEYIDEVLRNAPEVATAGGVTRQDAIIGPTIEVFLHEVGHAIFHLLKVPILGREEDAADHVASYLMLHLDKDIAPQAVGGVAFMYGHEMKSQTPRHEQFAGVHGVAAQRFYNLLCLAYGEDPKLFADLVEKKYLPESRAEGCADEYKQVDYAFRKLIYGYIDQAQVKKVKPKKLLRPVQN